MPEEQRVRESVRSFLAAWLVGRDIQKAEGAFGNIAVTNEAILQASCAGYIKPEERGSDIARRAGIQKFLKDFLPTKPVTALGDVIDRDAVAALIQQLGSRVINDPKTDLFVLARLAAADLPVGVASDVEYLRKHLPPSFYVSFVPIGGGMIYFVWVPQGNEWRVYHASLVCM